MTRANQVRWVLCALVAVIALPAAVRARTVSQSRVAGPDGAKANAFEPGQNSANAEQSRSQIAETIDDRAVVRQAHTTHPLANAANDRGRADASLPMKRIVMVLKPSDTARALLKKTIDELHDPESVHYQNWYTPEQYAAQFGASVNDVAQITGWLGQHGFAVESVGQGGRWIEFSGTAGQVEAAFHTEIHKYEVHGEAHVANATDISLPHALLPVVSSLISLHDFRPKPMNAHGFPVRRDPANGRLVPVSPSGARPSGEFTPPGITDPNHFLAPGDWSRIYNTQPLLQQDVTGAGISIAIVGSDTNIELSDVEAFRQIFGLPANDPVVYVNGIDPGIIPLSDAEVEADLDTEWSGAVAPGATIRFVTSASTSATFGGLLSISYIVDNRLAPIMSVSVGSCEAFIGPGGNEFLDAAFEQAAAEGISVFVASGDNGAAGCDPQISDTPAQNGPNVSGFASTPYDVAVGGTMFAEKGRDADFWLANNRPDFSTAIGYIPENVWNETCDPTTDPNFCGEGFYVLSSSSGGPSNCTESTVSNGFITCQSGYAKPSWQAAAGVPNDGARDVPDVALAAAGGHDAYLMCVEGFCQTSNAGGQTQLENAFVVGGTSAAAPSMAGLMALIEQKTGSFQGLVNYNLYKLAAAEQLSQCNASQQTNPNHESSCAFYDVTAGNNSVPGLTGYNAGAGYDMATGLGSINAGNLANEWGTIAKLPTATSLASTTTSILAQHGQPIPFSVSVAPASGAGIPSGDFSLLAGDAALFGGTLANAGFNGNITGLPGGSYTVNARYGGDAMFASSTSGSVNLTVTPEESTVTVQGFDFDQIGGGVQPITGPTTYGDLIFLQVNVQGKSGVGAATGDVMIQLDQQPPFGPFPLNEAGGALVEFDGINNSGFNDLGHTGLGRLSATGLLAGNHSVQVNYGGDSSFHGAKAAPVAFSVIKGTPQGIIEPLQNAYTAGAPVDFILAEESFSLAQGVKGLEQPTGTVQLFDCGPQTSNACTRPVAVSAPIPLAVTTKSLQFPEGFAVSQATCRAAFTKGVHAIRMTYSGDANYLSRGLTGFDAPIAILTVGEPHGLEANFQLKQSPSTISVGQSANYLVTASATEAGDPQPTGSVSLSDEYGDALGGPVALTNGSASFTVPWYFTGPELIYVSYSGDAKYAAINSVALATTVVRPGTPEVTLDASAVTAALNSSTTLIVNVIVPPNPNVNSPALEGGRVEFFDSVNGAPPVLLGAGPEPLTIANGGNGVFVLSATLPRGTNEVTAKFLGTPSWAVRVSNPVVVDVP
jgi:hypothetical protein